METWRLVLTSVLQALAAALFVLVGYRLSQRNVTPEARSALRGFVAWWYGVALLNVLGIAFSLYSTATTPSAGVFVADALLLVAVTCVISFGLLGYLLYLYTGRRTIRVFLGAFYIAWFLAVLAYVFSGDPRVVEAGGKAVIDYASALPDWVASILGILLVAPLLAGALAYALLYFRVETRTQKYRIALVSLGFLLWFGSSFFGTVTQGEVGGGSKGWWPVASQLVGLVAALLVLLAYNPPTWLRQRFHIAAVLSEG